MSDQRMIRMRNKVFSRLKEGGCTCVFWLLNVCSLSRCLSYDDEMIENIQLPM